MIRFILQKTAFVCRNRSYRDVFIMRVDYWTWRTWSKILIAVCFLLLLLVLIPGIGMERNGSRSWIGVSAFSIQPSEFMKLAMIAFLAKFLSEKQKYHILS